MSEAIIFRHFANKEELYKAIIDYKGCGGAGSDAALGAGRPAVIDEVCGAVGGAMEASDDLSVFRGVALHMLEHHQADPEFLRATVG